MTQRLERTAIVLAQSHKGSHHATHHRLSSFCNYYSWVAVFALHLKWWLMKQSIFLNRNSYKFMKDINNAICCRFGNIHGNMGKKIDNIFLKCFCCAQFIYVKEKWNWLMRFNFWKTNAHLIACSLFFLIKHMIRNNIS